MRSDLILGYFSKEAWKKYWNNLGIPNSTLNHSLRNPNSWVNKLHGMPVDKNLNAESDLSIMINTKKYLVKEKPQDAKT